MPTSLPCRVPRNPTRTQCLVVIVVCLATAAAIVSFGRPSVGELAVSYPDNPDLGTRPIDVPFQRESKDKVTRFVIDARISLTPLSSSILRISPDDCIESISVSGGEPHDLGKLDGDKRCFPYSYTFDAGDRLHPGANTLRLEMKNKEGPYGIERITPMLTQNAVLIVAVLLWAAVYAALDLFITSGHEAGVASSKNATRRLARYSLPALGLLMTASQLLNAWDTVSLLSQPLVFFAATVLQTALLLRLLDGLRDQPLAYRPSPGWAAVCVLAFVAVALKSPAGYDRVERFLLTVLGVVAGVFAVTPVFATLHRARRIPAAVAIAGGAAAMPLAYDQMRLPLWEMLVAPTTHAVASIVSALGWEASTSFGEKRWGDGTVQDYHGYVTTPDFSIQIGAWCGGFEGMTLFLFLLAAFVLLDWPFFSRRKRLWVPLAATIPYLFAVNVLRIAAILVYALLIAGEVNHDAAQRAAVETFHSNVGWVVYSMAFGPYLWAVYRWAGRPRRNAEH